MRLGLHPDGLASNDTGKAAQNLHADLPGTMPGGVDRHAGGNRSVGQHAVRMPIRANYPF
jgi:hypothetical protein